nr:esterase family protein [Brevundimonas denitrificans]
MNRRNIDFQSPGEGVEQAGAEAFQRFLKAELLPRIEANYRSDPQRRVLFGQSRGGAFVLYSAVTDPDLFWGRIASNPSITPGIESLLEPAAEATRADLGVVVTSGTRDPSRPAGRGRSVDRALGEPVCAPVASAPGPHRGRHPRRQRPGRLPGGHAVAVRAGIAGVTLSLRAPTRRRFPRSHRPYRVAGRFFHAPRHKRNSHPD